MGIYILNADRDAQRGQMIEKRIQKAIPELVKIDRVEDASRVSVDQDGLTYVIVILAAQDRSSLKNFLDAAAKYGDPFFFLLIGDEISASEYKMLLRTGKADWVSASAEASEILETIAQSRAAAHEKDIAEQGPRKAVVATVASSGGGAGNATLATEVGIQLSQAKGTRNKRICIIDLDFQSSHICDYLDIEPRLQIAEISNNPGRLDAHLFEIFVTRHSSGLHIFAAPRSKLDICNLNISALDRFFEMVSARYDLMLIDLPPVWFAWTPRIVFASDAVVVTGLNTIPSLRQTVETVSAVRDAALPDAKIAVVVNRCERHLVRGIIRRRHVETLLSNERVFYVGEERMATQSVNSGAPMALTNSYRSIRKDIASLAAFFSELKSLKVDAD
jgi:Flp pilus assembly CpaE family ATPase